MNHQNQVRCLFWVFITALIIPVLIPGMLWSEESDTLKIYNSTVTFKHFDYALYADHTMKSYNPDSITDTVFPVQVIENKYLKVTLLPKFGGRILSIIYKPTGHEQLYQNPMGTPYGIGEGNFYYNWLMVYGGIFPTFPEPEHGKTWCLPWKSRISVQSKDEIAVEMSFTDNIARTGAVPGRFTKGKTGITCVATVTVYKDKPYVKLRIKLINPQKKTVNYEYWTCTTLAPGSEPGKTISPPNSEIVVPVRKVKVKDDWWPWMGTVEKRAGGPHIFNYQKLALFSNWADMGIAYAYPDMEKEWWGVINHRNEEGIFRIANNRQYTPGVKFWTWGYRQGSSADPRRFGDARRPYIELWAGNSREFFKNAQMAAGEEKTWDEYYIPTVGLSKVTYANLNALVYLDVMKDRAKNQFNFTAKVFTTRLDEMMNLNLKLTGKKNYDLATKNFVGDPTETSVLSVSKSAGSIAAGKYSYEMILQSATGDILAKAAIPFEIR